MGGADSKKNETTSSSQCYSPPNFYLFLDGKPNRTRPRFSFVAAGDSVLCIRVFM